MKLENVLEGITRRARGSKHVYDESYWVLYSPSTGLFAGNMQSVDSPKYATPQRNEDDAVKIAESWNNRAANSPNSGQPRDEAANAPWEAREIEATYRIR